MDDCQHLPALGDDPETWNDLDDEELEQVIGVKFIEYGATQDGSLIPGMSALLDEFTKTFAGMRSVGIAQEEGLTLVRRVTGWPQPREDSKPWERDEQSKLDADLETRISGYFEEIGENAYAMFNTMTDIASRPPQSPRFRGDRSTVERRAAARLRDLNASAALPGFNNVGHLSELATGARP